ncbi:VOC family protein [Qipengyuania oceanensis]|uniref:VOC family protein n=1 Tax=Qipengyuania oceanensis TaxID=1463597 RepID=A0A844YG05_9SPHN|nr:VOC family protein [Qipengyuania oceanensis]
MSGLALATFLVPDYDVAIAFFRDALDFAVVEDSDLGDGKRWVVVGGASGGRLLLARAANEQQRAVIGKQAGGRVGWFLHTEDFAADHRRMVSWGVEFTEEPRHETYGTVAVFRDPWGNPWDLIEQRKAA